ncbi:MAG: NAD-dependent epimerase/dehydratase family protein [Phycisphaerales bacterium]
MPQAPTYIVTGGAGFVGSNLVAALLAREPRPRVVVVDTFRTGTFANLVEACDRRGVGSFDGDVIPESAGEIDWDGLVTRLVPDAVFHEAAITDTTLADEREMVRENAEGFRGVLRECVRAGVPLVYASSAATYGSPAQARDRVPFPLDAAGRASNVYGFSKWLMEVEHRRIAGERTSRGEPAPWVVGLRYFNVFGPGEAAKGKMASMAYQLARQMLEGRAPRVFADGSQTRDQVYIDDVVDCTLTAAGLGDRRDPAPGVYNLGSGVSTSFNQVIAALRGPLGVSPTDRPTEYFDMPSAIRAFYQDYTCADMSATVAGLGWRPRWKPADGIAEYARHLRAAPGPSAR